MSDVFLNKVVIFDEPTGCIDAGSVCFCYGKEGSHYWVAFKNPILGRNDIKLHEAVILKFGRVVE